jgi:hypothetical protein
MRPNDFEDVPDPVDRKPIPEDNCPRDGWAIALLFGILVGIVWTAVLFGLFQVAA